MGLMDIREAIKYEGENENLVHEDEFVSIFEVRRTVRNSANAVQAPGSCYRVQYRKPMNREPYSYYVDFASRAPLDEFGLTERAMAAMLLHRLEALSRESNDAHQNLSIRDALEQFLA